MCLIVLTCIGFLVYVFVFSPHIGAVHLNNGAALKAMRPGDAVKINADMRSVDKVQVLFSVTEGAWSTAIESTSLPTTWNLPADTYSETCRIRVADPTLPLKRFADSAKFAVRPTLRITSDIMRRNVSVYVPGIIVIQFEADSGLINGRNMRIQTSSDGMAFADVVERDSYRVFPTEGRVVWNLTNDLAGTSKYVRLTTSDLQKRGFSAEVFASTRHPVVFVENTLPTECITGASTIAGFKFQDLVVRHTLKGTSGNAFAPHQPFYLTYSIANGSVVPSALVWEYSINKGKTYAPLRTTLFAQTTYTAVIPAMASPTIRFRLKNLTTFVVTPDYVCEPTLTLTSMQYELANARFEAVVRTDGTLEMADLTAIAWKTEVTLMAGNKTILSRPSVAQIGRGTSTALSFLFATSEIPKVGSAFAIKVADLPVTLEAKVEIV